MDEGELKTKRTGRRLTKRAIDSLKPKTKPYRVYDTEKRGFFLTVTPAGTKTFGVRFGPRNRRRWLRVGVYGEMTLEDAREAAGRILAKTDLGQDPAAEREKRAAMPTFGEWATTRLEDLEKRRKHPEQIRYYVGLARERWDRRALDEITPADVTAFHSALGTAVRTKKDGSTERKRTPAKANRALAHIAALFASAVRHGVIPSNPAVGVETFRENPPRDRTLSEEELPRLNAALKAEPDEAARAAFRLALETGARVGEILGATWDDFDLEGLRWRLPDPKAGTPQVIVLAPETAAWLKLMKKRRDKRPASDPIRKNPYVIAGEKPGARRYDLKGPWRRIRAAAGLEDVGIHDLRRTFGKLVTKEAGIHMASKMLRHSDVRITAAIYSPLAEAEMRGAAAKVVPFLRRKA